MWTYETINFQDMLKHINENKNIPYTIKLIEKNRYQNTISVYRHDANYSELPWHFEIRIQNNLQREIGKCEFEIMRTNVCEIVNIESEYSGLGSILFHIMEGIMRRIEFELNINISEIYGSLVNKHKESKEWLKSIPFYCMKAYEYSYNITFSPSDDKCRITKIEASHDERYQNALLFAQYFLTCYDNGAFCITRN
ncbi:MAG: hypothetical protein ACRDBO_07590 [Lachnospiraceae bacterium]